MPGGWLIFKDYQGLVCYSADRTRVRMHRKRDAERVAKLITDKSVLITFAHRQIFGINDIYKPVRNEGAYLVP